MPKILGVIDGAPFHTETYSGSSKFLFEALDRKGYLCAAIDATPAKPVQLASKLRNFDPDVEKWRFKYHLDPRYFDSMTRTARARARRASGDFDATLQVGAVYDLTGLAGTVSASYHDGNLTSRLQAPYGYPRISPRRIGDALAYEASLYRRLDRIFTMSSWLADSFVRDIGIPASKVFPVGAGINLPEVAETAGRSYDEPTILFVGKEFERKGGALLLEAFRLVRKSVKDARLTIVGPPARADLPAGVACTGPIARSRPGGFARLVQAYKEASIFVMPSLYEPFGIAFLEAMAHRLPCIGGRRCAMPEIIEEGVTGYTVDPRDPDALAERMLRLLRDPEACRAMGENGYARYKARYTWDAVAESIALHLRETAS